MNRTQLPMAPHPDAFTSIQAWQLAVHTWMNNVKAQIETDSVVNTAPVAPFVVGSFTPVSTITGTDTISNFIATLIDAMNKKGITAPNAQRKP